MQTSIISFKQPLYLKSGRILEDYKLIYETYGTINKDKTNVILVTHALTGSHKASNHGGWWHKVIGSKKCIDTDRYFVICINVIGSCFGSTGPGSIKKSTNKKYGFSFPVITIEDIVHSQKILLEHLGITTLKAVIGGSLGGMQALYFGVKYPNLAENIVSISSTPKTRAWTIAFNKVVIEAIRKDIESCGDGTNGLRIGRMAGHISFLSPQSMDIKFGNSYVATDGLYELFGRFEVERYLEYNANKFVQYFDPLSYLYLLKAINIFDLSREYGSFEDAFKDIKAKFCLITFSGDLLFLPNELEQLKDVFKNIGKKNLLKLHGIQSNYGHDGFLVEFHKFQHIINDIL